MQQPECTAEAYRTTSEYQPIQTGFQRRNSPMKRGLSRSGSSTLATCRNDGIRHADSELTEFFNPPD